MISPSPGMIWPASTTTRSPGSQRRRRDLLDRAVRAQPIGRRVAPRAAERLRLRLAARLGERGGEVGEEHRQEEPHIERDEDSVTGTWLAQPPSSACDDEQQRQDGADLDART